MWRCCQSGNCLIVDFVVWVWRYDELFVFVDGREGAGGIAYVREEWVECVSGWSVICAFRGLLLACGRVEWVVRCRLQLWWRVWWQWWRVRFVGVWDVVAVDERGGVLGAEELSRRRAVLVGEVVVRVYELPFASEVIPVCDERGCGCWHDGGALAAEAAGAVL